MKIIMYFIHRFLDGRKLRKAIRQAKKSYQTKPDRYYVIADLEMNLYVLNKWAFKKLRHDGYFHHMAFVRDLREAAFYYTPYANGSQAISGKEQSEKRIEFLKFCVERRMNLKEKQV